MKTLITELKFDGRRLVLRNAGFQFFSLLMPAMFYVLFTKVMVTVSSPEQAQFNLQYMGSMIVYSGMINALFSIANILMRDRQQGLVRWLQLTAHGLRAYYTSLACWSLVMNCLSVAVLGTIATVVNHVQLSLGQWFSILLIVVVGQIPILLLGVCLSFINRTELLSVASNLIGFPMAIVSGLWWPISMLPNWLQTVGKQLPPYYVNEWLGAVMTHGTLKPTNLMGLLIWLIGLSVVVTLVARRQLRWGGGFVNA